MIVYSLSDAIPVKIGEFVFHLKPLQIVDKEAIARAGEFKSGEQTFGVKTITETLKRAILKVDGLEKVKYPDGRQFELVRENGLLDDESLNVIFQICNYQKISQIAIHLLASMFEFEIDGVEVVTGKTTKKKKRTS